MLLLTSFPMNILNIVCKGWFFYWCLNSFHMLVCHQINTEFVTLLVFTSCTCHPKTSKNEYDIWHIHSLCLISHMVVPRIKRFIQTEWMSFHLKKKKWWFVNWTQIPQLRRNVIHLKLKRAESKLLILMISSNKVLSR